VRRPVVVLAVAVLLTVALAGCGGHHKASTVVIRLKSVVESNHKTDKPPTGASKGDVWVERDTLFNVTPDFGKAANAMVGTDKATITFQSTTEAHASGTATLPDGTISFGGETSVAGAMQLIPVVGGTRAYAHASGSLVITNAAVDTLNTYHLTLP
jgi:hypothetical protein